MPKKQVKQNEIYCHCCGQALTDENCRAVNNSQSGYSHLCVECENDLYQNLAKVEGDSIALFHTCAALNVPCLPIALDGVELTYNENKDGWLTYINLLAEKGLDRKKGKILGFADGLTSLVDCFGKNLSHTDFAERVKREKEAIAKRPKQIGSDAQIAKWGQIPIVKGYPFTQELYDELDRLLEIRESAYKGQDLNPQQKETLIQAAKADASYNYLMSIGNIQQATNVQKAVSQRLADENMRAKDKKPVEELRLDALVLALEDAGLMENGDLLTYDELIEVMRDKFVKSPKYQYSLDVADQMMLDIINSMRQNADLMPIQDLPEEYAPVDEYGEFMPEETEKEKENKKYLGVTKVNIVKKEKGEKENGSNDLRK